MSRMTEKQINIAAAKYAGARMLALVYVLVLNWFLVFKIGMDLRDWEWWVTCPTSSIFVTIALIKLAEK